MVVNEVMFAARAVIVNKSVVSVLIAGVALEATVLTLLTSLCLAVPFTKSRLNAGIQVPIPTLPFMTLIAAVDVSNVPIPIFPLASTSSPLLLDEKLPTCSLSDGTQVPIPTFPCTNRPPDGGVVFV